MGLSDFLEHTVILCSTGLQIKICFVNMCSTRQLPRHCDGPERRRHPDRAGQAQTRGRPVRETLLPARGRGAAVVRSPPPPASPLPPRYSGGRPMLRAAQRIHAAARNQHESCDLRGVSIHPSWKGARWTAPLHFAAAQRCAAATLRGRTWQRGEGHDDSGMAPSGPLPRRGRWRKGCGKRAGLRAPWSWRRHRLGRRRGPIEMEPARP